MFVNTILSLYWSLKTYYQYVLKVNGYAYRESNSVSYIFASLVNGGQLLKERICFLMSNCLPAQLIPFGKGFVDQESKQEVTKHEYAPMYLKVNGYSFRGNNSSIFIFASLLYRGQFLKERICSSRRKLEVLHRPAKHTGSH